MGVWVVALLACVLVAPFLVLVHTLPSAPRLISVNNAHRLALGEGNIRFEDEGTGPNAVLFLHGFNSQLGYWNKVWDALGPVDRKVRIDIPGFGGSTFELPSYELEPQARRILEFLDLRGIRQVTIIAESMGASLAAVIAAYYPARISRLALLAPSGYTGALRYPGLHGMLLRPGKLRDWAVHLARSRPYKYMFPDSKALQALTVPYSYGPRWVAILPRVQAPTLVVWSRGDFGVSFTTAEDVARAIPNARLLWLDEKTGHLISHRRPELVADFTSRLARGATLADLVKKMPAGLLREGEGFAAPMPRWLQQSLPHSRKDRNSNGVCPGSEVLEAKIRGRSGVIRAKNRWVGIGKRLSEGP
jgi:pimeloyl-ACP methyl ester carboxylesterase